MSATTTLVILGVEHSAQLVAESYRPAIFRAFFARVRPDVLCIEWPPEKDLHTDSYAEYGFELRHIVIPWARDNGVPIDHIDWVPVADDQMLVWGVPDIDAPGIVRKPGSARPFLRFGADALALDLFFAEADLARERIAAWYDQPRQAGERDFPRRLGLYRTFLQAMRIRDVARRHPGKTILVVIGYFHKHDIERILINSTNIEFVQPSAFGHPMSGEVAAAMRAEDHFAILSFNLLGVQSPDGAVDWDWQRRLVDHLSDGSPSAETLVLRTRLAVLQEGMPPVQALGQYERARALPGAEDRFTFDGVVDRRRIDSYYDPFGNLTVGERAMLECAREQHKLGHDDAMREARHRLAVASHRTDLQRRQLDGYWDEYVLGMP